MDSEDEDEFDADDNRIVMPPDKSNYANVGVKCLQKPFCFV